MFLPIALLAQTLYFQTPSGDIYTAVNDVPAGACVLTGDEELVFEATNFNTCNEIVLAPGCYRAELRGGVGMPNEYCRDHITIDEMDSVAALFSLSQQTTIYAMRGGDGNPGGVVLSSSAGQSGAFGGGASGVDTILVVGDRVWRANGGAGKTCAVSTKSPINLMGQLTSTTNANGLGGKSGFSDSVSVLRGFYYANKNTYGLGGGGGGAPDVQGATQWFVESNFPRDDIVIDAGADGTSAGGGDGGDIVTCKSYSDSCAELVSANGGAGGASVFYSCGGQVAVSYGGGGGGASYSTNYPSAGALDGGDGGSGSTGTSDVSFLRIYKM